MTSTVATNRSARVVHHPGRYDRLFFGGVAVFLALTVFVGFWASYYAPLLFGGTPATFTGRPFTPMLYLHGAAFTAWVLLFVVQTALVSTRRVSAHRRLGVAGAVLAACMIVIGLTTVKQALLRGSAPPGIDARTFAAVPLFDMLLFTVFMASGLLLRRRKDAHKRLMLLAYVSLMAAAFARLPFVTGGPIVPFSLAFTVVVAGVLFDLWTRGRVHPALLWGGTALGVSIPLRLIVGGTGPWLAFVDWFAG